MIVDTQLFRPATHTVVAHPLDFYSSAAGSVAMHKTERLYEHLSTGLLGTDCAQYIGSSPSKNQARCLEKELCWTLTSFVLRSTLLLGVVANSLSGDV
jgi:hypothetical protein